VLAVLLAIGVGVYFGLRSDRDGAADLDAVVTTPTESIPTQPADPPVRESAKDLFARTCGSCHTLASAGVTGGIGPNLDEAKPSRERTLTMIRNGSLSGAMPLGLLTGDDAERVAAYVSRNARR
jgi:mono/diheme cytochrome c family protein